MKNNSANANTKQWKEQRSIGRQLLPERQRNNDARKERKVSCGDRNGEKGGSD